MFTQVLNFEIFDLEEKCRRLIFMTRNCDIWWSRRGTLLTLDGGKDKLSELKGIEDFRDFSHDVFLN